MRSIRSRFLQPWLVWTGRLSSTGLLAAVCLVAGQAAAVVIYDFVPYTLPNGYSIDGGTITVTDTAAANGKLELAEVVAYSVQVTDLGGAYTFSGPTGAVTELDGVSITPTAISVPVRHVSPGTNILVLGTPGFDDVFFTPGSPRFDGHVLWQSTSAAGDPLNEVSVGNRGNSFEGHLVLPDPSPVVVATVAVPEPQVAALVGVGLVCLAIRRRSIRGK